MALALFDLDETLIAGDSASLWLAYMVAEAGSGQHDRRGAGDDVPLPSGQDGHAPVHGLHPATAGRQDAPVARLALHPLCRAGTARSYLSGGLARIEWHRQRGDELVLISASGEHLVAPMAQMLGMDHCVAILLDEEAGMLTGQTRGTLSFREGKVARINQLFAASANPWRESHGYSDSHNDLPLLQAVTHPTRSTRRPVCVRSPSSRPGRPSTGSWPPE